MTKFHSTCLCALICFVLLSICQVGPAQGVKSKETTDSNPVLHDLLVEVHGLRLAMERATTNASRAQILMERVRVAQSKVDNLTDKLSLVREKITYEIAVQTSLTAIISNCESKFPTTINQEVHIVSNEEKRCGEYPAQMEDSKQTELRLRAQESPLATQLQIEQSKLDELNGRLDKLDRELQDAQPVNKTPTRKNP